MRHATTSRTPKPAKPRTVELVRSSHQPSSRELNADADVPASFDEAVEPLTQPVNIRYIDRPRTV